MQRAQMVKQQEKAQSHGCIADARNHEGLARGPAVGRVRVPETDEQITAQSDAFPAEIQQQEIVAHHQNQHGADEQVHVGEKTTVVPVFQHKQG